jgi:DNA-binding XRE family transcriptional regulator
MKTNTIPKEHINRFNQISGFIRNYRINQGIAQRELGQSLHRNTVINAEAGRNITLLSLFDLADELGLSVQDIFEVVE